MSTFLPCLKGKQLGELYKIRESIEVFDKESNTFIQTLSVIKRALNRPDDLPPVTPEYLDENIKHLGDLGKISLRPVLYDQIKSTFNPELDNRSLPSYMLENKNAVTDLINSMITEILRTRSVLNYKISKEYLKRML